MDSPMEIKTCSTPISLIYLLNCIEDMMFIQYLKSTYSNLMFMEESIVENLSLFYVLMTDQSDNLYF